MSSSRQPWRSAAPRRWRPLTARVVLTPPPVPLYSRGPSRRSGRPASDPDGGWYVREGDHRGEEDHRGRVRGKVFWALEATILTMAPPVGDPAARANLVLGALLGRPGVDPGGSANRVCASVVARGHRPGILGADRAYSAAKADAFHLPLRSLGYRLVFDYRSDELGVQANSGGALLVEGAWCCPAMPAALISASTDRRAGRIDEQIYTARLAARADYRLVHKAGPDADGYERFACPAQGSHPRLCCPLRPASSAAPGALPVLEAPALAPPLVCCQGSITIAPDVGARHRQHLQFGSEEWHRRYATCRNTIEGLNGFAKDTAHECLAAPQRRRATSAADPDKYSTYGPSRTTKRRPSSKEAAAGTTRARRGSKFARIVAYQWHLRLRLHRRERAHLRIGLGNCELGL